MQEFSSVTASSYDAESLAPLLNEKAADGWSVVSIVAAGTNIVAYLQREADDDAPAGDEAPAASRHRADAPSGGVTQSTVSDDSATRSRPRPRRSCPVAAAPATAEDDAGSGRRARRLGHRPRRADHRARAEPATRDLDRRSRRTGPSRARSPSRCRGTRRRRAEPPKPLPLPSRPCPPAGTPTRRADSSCATGTGSLDRALSAVPASSTPIRPSPDPVRDRLGSSLGLTTTLGPSRARRVA